MRFSENVIYYLKTIVSILRSALVKLNQQVNPYLEVSSIL